MTERILNGDAADFSPRAIRKQTLRHTLEHPSALYPAVFGILGAAGALLFNASPWLLGAGAVGILASLGSWGVNFGFRREQFARVYVQRMMREMERSRQRKVQEIRDALQGLNSEEGLSQFRRLGEKFDTFRALLDRKLDPGELAHARYLGMGEQVYLAALDNLNTVVNLLRSLSVIDDGYIQTRLQALTDDDPHSIRERSALEQRLTLRTRQAEKVRGLLALNEAAMTHMDHTLLELAELQTGDSQATMDMESAMSELSRIAARVKAF